MPDVHDLGLMIEAHTPLIVIETRDEPRAMETLNRLSVKRRAAFYAWSLTEGLQRRGFGFSIDEPDDIVDPEKLLEYIGTFKTPTVFALCDFHPFLSANNPRMIRLVKDIAQNHQKNQVTLRV